MMRALFALTQKREERGVSAVFKWIKQQVLS